MSRKNWTRFEEIVRAVAPDAPSEARANGVALSRLMEAATHSRPAPGPLDWMDWERQKTLRLLRAAV